ncbi:MAG: hypothetical protein METHP_01837 [Methanoregula sp. SKADARSKE-2]|nr:MAG: hypothetical protein METHP_01837 [Methanoregula sp. SKADARSKE-2]
MTPLTILRNFPVRFIPSEHREKIRSTGEAKKVNDRGSPEHPQNGLVSISRSVTGFSLCRKMRKGSGPYETLSPFSLAISTNAWARYSACFRVVPYVLNFQTLVAPGIRPVTPLSSRALEK